MKIYSVKEKIDSTKITLGNPGRIQGGSYYAKLFYNNDDMYIRVNNCSTKNKVIEGKKSYVDIMFTIHESEYIDYLHQIETRIKEILSEKSGDWFSNINPDDIEHFFNSCMKIYKTHNNVLRSYVGQRESLQACSVFDEHNVQVSYDSIQEGTKIACILHIKGLRFTSNSFQLDIDNKQILLLPEKNDFDTCLLNLKEQEAEAKATEAPKESLEAEEVESKTEEAEEPVDNKEDLDATIREYDIGMDELSKEDTISLRDPKEVYREMYRIAKKKARDTRKMAIQAYLDVREIQSNYSLSDEDDDEEEEEELYDNEELKENLDFKSLNRETLEKELE